MIVAWLKAPFAPRPIPAAPALALVANDDAQPWPDDLDAVPDWVHRAEALRQSIGIQDPLPYRTRREFLAQLARIETGADAHQRELQPALSCQEGALQFLASIQHDEIVGEYAASELNTMYEEHCNRHRLTPSAIDHVKACLALLPGVHRQQKDTKDPETNRRKRTIMWIIAPLAELNIGTNNDPSEVENEYAIAA